MRTMDNPLSRQLDVFKPMSVYSLFLLFLAVSSNASTYIGWGVGHDGSRPDDQTKWIELGHQTSWRKFDIRYGLGGWADVHMPKSFYGQYQIGVETKDKGVFLSYYLGPALLTATDKFLGSNIQLSHTLKLGYRDFRHVSIAAVVKHFSNAEIVKPNIGRNLIGIEGEF